MLFAIESCGQQGQQGMVEFFHKAISSVGGRVLPWSSQCQAVCKLPVPAGFQPDGGVAQSEWHDIEHK